MTESIERLNTCPFCGKRNELVRAAYGHGRAVPEAGDMSLCMGCGEYAVFEADGTTLRKPTHEEYAELVAHPEHSRVRAAWLEAKRLADREAKVKEITEVFYGAP